MIDLLKDFSRYLNSQGLNKVSVSNYLSDISKFVSWFTRETGQTISAQNLKYSYISLYRSYLLQNQTPPGNIRRYLSSIKKFYFFLKPSTLSSIPEISLPETSNFRSQQPENDRLFLNFKNYLQSRGLSRLSVVISRNKPRIILVLR